MWPRHDFSGLLLQDQAFPAFKNHDRSADMVVDPKSEVFPNQPAMDNKQ